MKKAKFLIVILLFAAFLRIFALDKNPPSLFGDEVDAGYQAYSLLKTGRDYKGNFLPVYMDSLAEPRAPLLMYVTAPFIKVFGLNEWGVRLPSAVFGILSIFLLSLIVKELFADQVAAAVAAFLMTIAPWHLSYSRTAFEVSLLLFLILMGTYAFLRALKGRSGWLLVAIFSFSLTFYTYSTANIFVPLWAVSIFLVYRQEITKRWLKSATQAGVLTLFGLLLVSPIIYQTLRGSASFRFKLVSIFSDRQVIDAIIYKRNTAVLSPIVERLFHNKPVYWLKDFLSNYLEAFSFRFLFVGGDPNPRHTVPGIGLLFISFIPPLLLGIYQAIKQKKPENQLILSWLLISPVASSLTAGGNLHATRLILLLPPLIILAALGASYLFKTKTGKYLVSFLVLFLVFEFSFYLHEAIFHYPREQALQWHYGYKEAMQLYRKNKNLCQKIYINNSHSPFLIRYLFWTATDPRWFQKNFNLDKEDRVADEVFLSFGLGESYFGRIIVANKEEGIKRLVSKKGACYLAFQEDEVPGNWNWQSEPPAGIKVLGLINDAWGKPYIYLLAKGD